MTALGPSLSGMDFSLSQFPGSQRVSEPIPRTNRYYNYGDEDFARVSEPTRRLRRSYRSDDRAQPPHPTHSAHISYPSPEGSTSNLRLNNPNSQSTHPSSQVATLRYHPYPPHQSEVGHLPQHRAARPYPMSQRTDQTPLQERSHLPQDTTPPHTYNTHRPRANSISQRDQEVQKAYFNTPRLTIPIKPISADGYPPRKMPTPSRTLIAPAQKPNTHPGDVSLTGTEDGEKVTPVKRSLSSLGDVPPGKSTKATKKTPPKKRKKKTPIGHKVDEEYVMTESEDGHWEGTEWIPKKAAVPAQIPAEDKVETLGDQQSGVSDHSRSSLSRRQNSEDDHAKRFALEQAKAPSRISQQNFRASTMIAETGARSHEPTTNPTMARIQPHSVQTGQVLQQPRSRRSSDAKPYGQLPLFDIDPEILGSPIDHAQYRSSPGGYLQDSQTIQTGVNDRHSTLHQYLEARETAGTPPKPPSGQRRSSQCQAAHPARSGLPEHGHQNYEGQAVVSGNDRIDRASGYRPLLPPSQHRRDRDHSTGFQQDHMYDNDDMPDHVEYRGWHSSPPLRHPYPMTQDTPSPPLLSRAVQSEPPRSERVSVKSSDLPLRKQHTYSSRHNRTYLPPRTTRNDQIPLDDGTTYTYYPAKRDRSTSRWPPPEDTRKRISDSVDPDYLDGQIFDPRSDQPISYDTDSEDEHLRVQAYEARRLGLRESRNPGFVNRFQREEEVRRSDRRNRYDLFNSASQKEEWRVEQYDEEHRSPISPVMRPFHTAYDIEEYKTDGFPVAEPAPERSKRRTIPWNAVGKEGQGKHLRYIRDTGEYRLRMLRGTQGRECIDEYIQHLREPPEDRLIHRHVPAQTIHPLSDHRPHIAKRRSTALVNAESIPAGTVREIARIPFEQAQTVIQETSRRMQGNPDLIAASKKDIRRAALDTAAKRRPGRSLGKSRQAFEARREMRRTDTQETIGVFTPSGPPSPPTPKTKAVAKPRIPALNFSNEDPKHLQVKGISKGQHIHQVVPQDRQTQVSYDDPSHKQDSRQKVRPSTDSDGTGTPPEPPSAQQPRNQAVPSRQVEGHEATQTTAVHSENGTSQGISASREGTSSYAQEQGWQPAGENERVGPNYVRRRSLAVRKKMEERMRLEQEEAVRRVLRSAQEAEQDRHAHGDEVYADGMATEMTFVDQDVNDRHHTVTSLSQRPEDMPTSSRNAEVDFEFDQMNHRTQTSRTSQQEPSTTKQASHPQAHQAQDQARSLTRKSREDSVESLLEGLTMSQVPQLEEFTEEIMKEAGLSSPQTQEEVDEQINRIVKDIGKKPNTARKSLQPIPIGHLRARSGGGTEQTCARLSNQGQTAFQGGMTGVEMTECLMEMVEQLPKARTTNVKQKKQEMLKRHRERQVQAAAKRRKGKEGEVGGLDKFLERFNQVEETEEIGKGTSSIRQQGENAEASEEEEEVEEVEQVEQVENKRGTWDTPAFRALSATQINTEGSSQVGRAHEEFGWGRGKSVSSSGTDRVKKMRVYGDDAKSEGVLSQSFKIPTQNTQAKTFKTPKADTRPELQNRRKYEHSPAAAGPGIILADPQSSTQPPSRAEHHSNLYRPFSDDGINSVDDHTHEGGASLVDTLMEQHRGGEEGEEEEEVEGEDREEGPFQGYVVDQGGCFDQPPPPKYDHYKPPTTSSLSSRKGMLQRGISGTNKSGFIKSSQARKSPARRA